jgi:hypothetical protein
VGGITGIGVCAATGADRASNASNIFITDRPQILECV